MIQESFDPQNTQTDSTGSICNVGLLVIRVIGGLKIYFFHKFSTVTRSTG